MSALPIIITSAGLAALVNAANTGTEAVVITQVGISATTFAPTEATTAIPGEIKRLATIAGVVVADDTLHIAVSDTSADAYTLRTFGLYLDSGVLLAVYSSAASIAEKAAPATLLLNADIKLTSPLAGSIEFGDSSFANPPASETVVGVLRLATEAEALAGINGTRAITPVTMKSAIVSQLTAYAATVTAALAGKSAVGHTHAASETVSGTFDVARIPDLAMAKITGLVGALAAKANLAHTHAMADITGLAAALALKLDTVAFTWVNLAGKPDVVTTGDPQTMTGRKIGKGQVAGAMAAQTYINGPFEVQSLNAASAALMGFHIPGVVGESFGLDTDGAWKVTIGNVPRGLWHAGNFNPADKAAAVHTHDWTQVTGKPWFPVFLQGATATQIRMEDTNGDRRLHFYGDPDGWGLLNPAGGWSLRINAQALYFTANGTERSVWHTGNFNPADKAAAIHSHDWAQITGKPDFTAASAAQFRANSSSQPLNPTGVWAAAQLVAAAQAATIAVDMSAALNFTTVMTGNRTLGAPSNAKPGQSGVIQLIQDATGGRTLAFNAAWKFEGGSLPTLSTAANARDVLVFTVIAANDVVASLMKDVR